MAEGGIIPEEPHGFPHDPGSHSQGGFPCEVVDWTERSTDGFGTCLIVQSRAEQNQGPPEFQNQLT